MVVHNVPEQRELTAKLQDMYHSLSRPLQVYYFPSRLSLP